MLLETVRQAQQRAGGSVEESLARLGLPAATYYRWQERERRGCLADQVVVPRLRGRPATPEEVQAVREFAYAHPRTGYKRLAWQMVDQNVVWLRPYQVYDILREYDLLSRRMLQPEPLKRPPPPEHPDERIPPSEEEPAGPVSK